MRPPAEMPGVADSLDAAEPDVARLIVARGGVARTVEEPPGAAPLVAE